MQRKASSGLRAILKREALNMREVAKDTGIPESTLHYWASSGIIPKKHRALLAQVIGCSEHDLAPQNVGVGHRMIDDKKALLPLESHGFFSFGNIATKLVVLDGNGTETYSPPDIQAFYDQRPVQFLEEIEQVRGEIEAKQDETSGRIRQWNGPIYHLANYQLSRDPVHEHMKVNLWFHPTDYFTVLAKNKCMKDASFREKYIQGYDWEAPFLSLPVPFGIGLSLLTVDGYIIFAQREGNLGVRPGYFMTSVEEGLSRPLDRGTTSDAPDVYRCACRGLFEELGLTENSDFSVADILFLGLGMDTEYYMCGLRGLIQSQKTAQAIIDNWQVGVKDKMENKKLFAIPFTLEDVCEFVFSHGPWGGGALMGIYHTLVHEFGRAKVDTVLSLH